VTSSAALSLAGITKRFGRLTAVENVSLEARPGTVHALLGENGAGKSTLMRVAFGMLAPDAGEVRVDGSACRFASPADAIAAGIGMVHQHFTNVPAMTVAENVALGRQGRYNAREAAARVREIAERAGLPLDPHARAGDLSVGAQQRLEIVKALGRDARVLILDEPTAVLAPTEANDLLRWLRTFANAGNAVVLITHKLREALAVADQVTVMRRGREVLSSTTTGMSAQTLALAIVGEPVARGSSAASAGSGSASGATVVAEMRAVELADDRGVATAHNLSLEVRAGEIVGIAAVEGAGQRELLRGLARRLPPRRGELRLHGSVGFVPEDRHADALVLDFSQVENVVLAGAGARRGVIDWTAARSTTERLAAAFDVRGGSPDLPVRALSGGNQQKLVLARELEGNPSLVVAENPTRGLDIRATADVHARLREAAANGAGVVIYSSDLDEVLELATRVVVMHAGHLVPVPHDREAVGRAMLGVS
jgi:simple sugar transport system ATP-binding protein